MWRDFRAPLHSTARESADQPQALARAEVYTFRRCSYGCAVDLWAIGCVLYELFSLKQLFRYVSTCLPPAAHTPLGRLEPTGVRFGAQRPIGLPAGAADMIGVR